MADSEAPPSIPDPYPFSPRLHALHAGGHEWRVLPQASYSSTFGAIQTLSLLADPSADLEALGIPFTSTPHCKDCGIPRHSFHLHTLTVHPHCIRHTSPNPCQCTRFIPSRACFTNPFDPLTHRFISQPTLRASDTGTPTPSPTARPIVLLNASFGDIAWGQRRPLRICVVDFLTGEVLMDTFVAIGGLKVLDYNTATTGVSGTGLRAKMREERKRMMVMWHRRGGGCEGFVGGEESGGEGEFEGCGGGVFGEEDTGGWGEWEGV
ncbi:hypothetical protein BJ508DRAFT_360674 [Ascobolus immersus RN42]|uniref:Uncharacterized protein n=1 Tax=Ascobolus immersus RN42 TaxID=1160509 RepID=A0A3N4IGI3_ASCIM|nr:hypothetical protein BJ508DRAFT_360674 [Ascobolus immersus RN42]